MNRICVSVSGPLILVSLLFGGAALQASPGAGGAQTKDSYPLRLVANLPREDIVALHRAVSLLGVTLEEAEALLPTGYAAVYLLDLGQVELLTDKLSAVAPGVYEVAGTAAGSGRASTRVVESLGERSIAEFLAGIAARFPGLETGAWGRYIMKVPRVAEPRHPPVGAPRASAQTVQGTVVSEGFEDNPWVRWQRYPDTTKQYTWEVTTCAAHSGSRSADGVRGGTVGSTLSCTDGYPLNVDNWIDDGQCENFQGASEAWLDLYVFLDCSSAGSDGFSLYYTGSDQHLYGYGYTGNVGSWFHLIFDLRHWYKLGDLTSRDCNKLSLLFESDEAGIQGTGVRVDDIRIQAGPISGLSCSAVASSLSGPAPLTVNFTANVSGASGTPTYDWWFSDGASASTPNVTHTFTSQGEYSAELSVTDTSSSMCSSSLKITVTSPGAALSAGVSASVTSGAAPLTVSFTGTASGGTAPYTYSWNFGDGTASSPAQNPTHTFTTAGTYTVTLTVHDAVSATATASTTITVTSQAAAYRYFVPAIAHNPGISNTMWRSNIGVVNRSGSSASLTVTFHTSSGDDTRSTTLSTGSAVEWANILESLFGVSPSTSIQGSLEIGSNVPLSIVARNFNETSAGTFGQYFPALTQQHALTSGQVGILPLLKKSSEFRTNIGAINLGTSACTILIKLFNASGIQVGTSITLTVPPGIWQQANDVFSTSGAGYQSCAYATTEIQTSGGLAWLYAAVVDARTGDPTTVPVLRP
jgi:PKD repeat protein